MSIEQSTGTTIEEVGRLSMRSQLRKLVGHSAIYGLGLVGHSIATLILIPVFLHRFSRAEYGMLEVLNVFASMLFNFLLLGIGAVLMKVYINDCRDDEERRLLTTSIAIFMGAMVLLLVVLSYVFSKPLAALLFKDGRYALLVLLAASSSGVLLIQQIALICLRAKQWPGKFAVVTLSSLAMMVALNVYFVWMRSLGVLGAQLASVLASGGGLALGFFLIRSELVPRFSYGILRHVLALSLPLIPATVAPWMLNVSDRYFLNHFCGLSATGLYAVGYKVGMLGIVILIGAFQLAWGPLFFASGGDRETPRLCASVLKYLVLVLVTGGMMLSVFAREILRLIAKPEYWNAGWIVPYIAISYVFFGAQFYTMPLFIRLNRGKWLSLIMSGAAVVNLSLNLILIPRFGITGAVAATLAAFSLQMVFSFSLVNRFYPVPYQYANLAKTLVAGALLCFVFRGIPVTSLISFLLKSLVLLAFALLLLASGFFSRRELEVMLSIPGKVVRKLCPQCSKAV